MPTPANVTAPEGEWTSLNVLTGLPTGTTMAVQNLTDVPVRVSTATDQPTDASGYNVLDVWGQMVGTANSGESHWILCQSRPAVIQVTDYDSAGS
jgi:hypothetical protein